MPRHEDPDHEWSYTRRAKDEFGLTFKHRKLIGRDSDVRGGIYYGTYGGEAIVVDPQKHPTQYDRYYALAAKRATPKGHIRRPEVLKAVFETVKTEMAYSQDGVERIRERVAERKGLPEFRDGTKIELDMFMGEGIGVCRHQALACAAILERFKDEGHIRGDISVDRNIRWNPRGDEAEGHAWVRYTSKGGGVMILDVAQDYFGLLEDSPREAQWNYMRPDEQRHSAASNLGHFGVDGAPNEPPLALHP